MNRPTASVLSATVVCGLALTSAGCTGSDRSPSTDSPTTTAASAQPAGSLGSLGSAGSAGGATVPVGDGAPQPVRGTVEVVRTLDHDPSLFTQGLEVVGDRVYESTGRYGQSQVQYRPLSAVTADTSVPMPAEQFGEGLAVTADTVWTLTWRAGVAHARDPQTLQPRSEVRYPGEGWGLCSDGERLVMSDGSDTLTFRDPVTFDEIGRLPVTAGGTPVARLNELDCKGGSILANVWMTDEIVRIDPGTGAVTHVYDASALEQPRPTDPDAVLNGIAGLDGTDTVLVTGKLWPHAYEVRLRD